MRAVSISTGVGLRCRRSVAQDLGALAVRQVDVEDDHLVVVDGQRVARVLHRLDTVDRVAPPLERSDDRLRDVFGVLHEKQPHFPTRFFVLLRASAQRTRVSAA